MDWRNSLSLLLQSIKLETEVINATYKKRRVLNIPLIVQARRMLRFNNSTGDAAFPFIDPLHVEFS